MLVSLNNKSFDLQIMKISAKSDVTLDKKSKATFISFIEIQGFFDSKNIQDISTGKIVIRELGLIGNCYYLNSFPKSDYNLVLNIITE